MDACLKIVCCVHFGLTYTVCISCVGNRLLAYCKDSNPHSFKPIPPLTFLPFPTR